MRIFSFILMLVLLSFPFTAFANETNDALTDALNKKLQEEHKDYKNSLEIIDSITTSAEVTEEDKTEKRNIQVVFAHAKKIEERDSIFYFDLKEIYYYDLDNQKIIESGAVQKTGQIKEFEDKYEKKVGKQLNAVTTTIFVTILLLGIVVWPILITAFHNSYRSSFYKVHLDQASAGMFRN